MAAAGSSTASSGVGVVLRLATFSSRALICSWSFSRASGVNALSDLAASSLFSSSLSRAAATPAPARAPAAAPTKAPATAPSAASLLSSSLDAVSVSRDALISSISFFSCDSIALRRSRTSVEGVTADAV